MHNSTISPRYILLTATMIVSLTTGCDDSYRKTEAMFIRSDSKPSKAPCKPPVSARATLQGAPAEDCDKE